MLRLQLNSQSRMSTTACHCSREKKLRAVKNSASWIIPGVMLALLPKCPLCLAAWFSLVLGIGISASAATALHTTLITLCLLIGITCLVRHIHRLRSPQNT
jgi:hypothetical protein